MACELRNRSSGREKFVGGIIFRFRRFGNAIVQPVDDGSLTPSSHLDHPLAAVFAGEQSDQRLRGVLQPLDDVLLDLELAGADP
jgi:hypothetical protein